MSFTQTVEAFIAVLENKPASPVAKEHKSSRKRLDDSTKRGIRYTLHMKGQAPENRTYEVPDKQKTLPKYVTSKEVVAHTKALASYREEVREALLALEQIDRRKLSALMRAGASKSPGDVRATFQFLRNDGLGSAAMASVEQIRNGLELAEAQGVDLDADTW